MLFGFASRVGAVVVLAAVFSSFAVAPSDAAPRKPAAKAEASIRAAKAAPTAYSSARSAATPAEAPAVSGASEDVPAGCQRSRKRLWVEDEGWVVRKVTTCF